jgi:hypothetical protein
VNGQLLPLAERNYRFDRDRVDLRELDRERDVVLDDDDFRGRDLLAALPPFRPPFFDAERFSFFPRPEPLFFPPPLSLLTVAHARRAASLPDAPRFL